MTSQEVLDAYLSFLWGQFQYDWGWLSNPWLLVIGNILYLMFFTIKWTVLLFPITIPIVSWRGSWTLNNAPMKNNDVYKNN